MRQWKIAGIAVLLILVLGGCQSGGSQKKLKDGCYTAQMSDYSFGWKEYVTIIVKNGSIVSTEYNAENMIGFIKSWDNAYMNNMKSVTGTYPNEYTRFYAAQLTGQKEYPEIDMISGASSSGNNFKRLAKAVVEQGIKGDSEIAVVQTEKE